MTSTVLEICNISKSFGAVAACDNVSLELRCGEIHALIGPNGAGKSTLIRQIAGELAPDAGRIFFDGRDISNLGAAARARAGLARSFQVSAVIAGYTALENVLLALVGRGRGEFRFFRPVSADAGLAADARRHLARVGIEDRAAIRASRLSHGERRRLEIAIALALEPKAFLLDEPMAGLGPEGSRSLTGFLSGLRDDAPILLVEHDMDAVFALADRVSVLVYGRIIASGSIDEVRSNPEVRKAYLGEELS